MSPSRRPFAVLVLALSVVTQRAQGVDAVEVELSARAVTGQGTPRLVVHVNAPVDDLTLELRRSDGVFVRRGVRRPKAGRDAAFDLPQPEGAFRYEGGLGVRFPKGPVQSMPLAFETSLLPPPKVVVGDDAVDLARRTVTLSADRRLATVRLDVYADDGTRLSSETHGVPDASAGTPVRLTWPAAEGATVLRLSLRAEDALGYFQQVELYPWSLELPHEEVLFASGRSDVTAAEREKLRVPLQALTEGLRRYGRVAPVKLFIAGFTDTVGDARSNQALSEARALAIARAFREAGVTLPLSYAGLGERGPLVATPDETDEPRNRRATYTLAVEAPRGVSWRELPHGPR
ncbi:MAG: hypothetical protein RL199_2516 [Pseudomonadota bacterium]|jgi:outer membrane protein OmpA-like peptidoglycan-associated protein